MRQTFRAKLLLIVLLSFGALGAMALVDLLSVQRVQRLLETLEGDYLPLMELGPEVQAGFLDLRRRMQDAVAAQDEEDLLATREARDQLLSRVGSAPPIVDRSEVQQLQEAIGAWYQVAYRVASHLIRGEVGTEIIDLIEQMQARQRQVEEAIASTLALDRGRLEDVFSVLRRAQAFSFQARMAVRLLLSIAVAILALGIARRIGGAVRELAAGFSRFGRGEFERPVEVTGDDELARLATDANRMAANLLDLNQRLRERQADLERTNKELEAFSYSVSHDLRAPLRGIDGFSLALLEDYGGQLPPEAQNYLHRVRAAAQRMGQLIDDLLQLSRLNRREMRIGPIDLSQIAREVADELAQREPTRRVEFTVAEGLLAEGDARLLRIALENLLGNAWKFTRRTPQPRVEVGSQARDDEVVYFIRDNGAGFEMKRAQQLFTPFKRLHHEAEYPGTGIGLAIVQRVIHRHGGRVWAEAAVNEGATFYFTIPPAAEGDGQEITSPPPVDRTPAP